VKISEYFHFVDMFEKVSQIPGKSILGLVMADSESVPGVPC